MPSHSHIHRPIQRYVTAEQSRLQDLRARVSAVFLNFSAEPIANKRDLDASAHVLRSPRTPDDADEQFHHLHRPLNLMSRFEQNDAFPSFTTSGEYIVVAAFIHI